MLLIRIIVVLSVFALFLPSCKKDKIITDSSAKLAFSEDSVLFDTVFTQVGSFTKYIRVLNPNNQKISISSLKLARGNASFYRLNVDGVPGKVFSDIEIAAKDSLYIFVEVTIDPNNSANPFVYQDSIVFETNGNIQDVDLYSVARNCYLHLPTNVVHLSNGGTFSYGSLPCGEIWNNDKPHLVFGYALIDSLCTLTINAGTEVYFHQNGGIVADRGGCLKVLGTQSQRVTFQGDRLEYDYKDVAGQWERIWLLDGSDNNEINYAIIKNSFIGIQAEPFAFYEVGGSVMAQRKVKITNTIIQNCSYVGIYSRFYKIEAGNNVISKCGTFSAYLFWGGSYSFRHCTFANYWSEETRTTPSVYINNYNSAQNFPLDSAYFVNCIIDGANAGEIQLDSAGVNGMFNNVHFKKCLLKTQLNTSNTTLFSNNQLNQTINFKDIGNNDFRLNSPSPAIDFGVVLPNYNLDLNGVLRDANPDVGAYEYVP
ncbi:MAG: choice-of-anchor Q domain-containing protein [Bacteroidota bacterium]|nr:choice-of-anchor Q domain-containing protein [Bacteroidota bacterium]